MANSVIFSPLIDQLIYAQPRGESWPFRDASARFTAARGMLGRCHVLDIQQVRKGCLNCVLKDELLLAREQRGHSSKTQVREVVYIRLPDTCYRVQASFTKIPPDWDIETNGGNTFFFLPLGVFSCYLLTQLTTQ